MFFTNTLWGRLHLNKKILQFIFAAKNFYFGELVYFLLLQIVTSLECRNEYIFLMVGFAVKFCYFNIGNCTLQRRKEGSARRKACEIHSVSHTEQAEFT